MTSCIRSAPCILIVFSILLLNEMGAQTYWSKRYDLDQGNDYGTQVVDHDGKLLILVKALCEYNTRFCGGIVSIDYDGTELWKTVYYDTLETNYDEAMVVHRDTIIVNMNYWDVGDKNYALIFFDLDGHEVRRIDYYYPGLQYHHWARGLTSYGDRVFACFVHRTSLQMPAREIIHAYDGGWNFLWEASVPNTFENPEWSDLEATPDGGFVIGYASWQNGTRERMATIEKYDADGGMEWQTPLSRRGSYDSDWVKLDLHPDGGYVGIWRLDTFAAYIAHLPPIVFKLDGVGNIEWERIDFYEQVYLYDLIAARNGDLIGCGLAEDWLWTNDDPEYRVAYIVRYNAQGEKIWDRRIVEENDGAYFYELYGGVELDNGDLVFTGIMWDTIYGTPDDPTPDNVWVIKVDSMGCFTPGCDEWQYVSVEDVRGVEKKERSFVAYPNPALDFVVLGAVLGAQIRPGAYTLLLHDLQGHLLYQQQFDPLRIVQIDTGHLVPGQYVITVLRDGVHEQTLSILIY